MSKGAAVRVVVIGATGHIGSYLVPRLVSGGHEVIGLSRGARSPYHPDPAFEEIEQQVVDREAEDQAGTFGARVAALEADAVVDLICFDRASAAQLAQALAGSATFLVHCGTIWVHGPARTVPVTEEAPRRPLEPYGIAKAEIEELLLAEHHRGALRACVLHPGHIVGPGWVPVNPAGNFDLSVFSRLARGEGLVLANFGLETLHHVHADDVAQAFSLALEHQEAAGGEAFHIVSPNALTLRGYAEAVADWFDQPARLTFLPFEQWREQVDEKEALPTGTHLSHSPSMSIDKARRLLGYEPAYSSLAAVRESLSWLIEQGEVDTAGRAPSDSAD
ncbi:MAG: NAD-dependent epimerase/dehydratase [Acidimicrobiaceae bacterium]|nr:NAD-dependent epimerase/dehydratase [Acidimicrobiaceae bacterium]